MTVNVSDTVKLHCPIVSDLEAYIQWFRVAGEPPEKENILPGELPNTTLIKVRLNKYIQ